MLVIGRDMNAQIGKNGNKYSLYNTSNRNGQHLTDFMIENRLACLNTNYQKREGKLWTYTYANNTKAQTDYVLIIKKWKNSALNCEAYSSFEGVSTDHRIVTAKIRLSLRKNAKWTATTKHYDWSLLNNRDIRDKCVLQFRKRYETLQERMEKSTPNDEYENFVHAHIEAAAKCIPTKLKTKYRVPWETLAVREKRALVKTKNGFRRNRSTNSQILTIRRILEGARAKDLQATLPFVDFTKAFDSIHRGKMEQILLAYGIPKETVAAITILYRNTKVKVRSPYGDTEYFDIVAGVLQGTRWLCTS